MVRIGFRTRRHEVHSVTLFFSSRIKVEQSKNFINIAFNKKSIKLKEFGHEM